MPSIRVAFVGAGEAASRHAVGLGSIPGVRLVTVFDPLREQAEAFARRHGLERVAREEREALAGGDLDLVVIASPHMYHAEQAIEALCAGKHVLCEKPLATTVVDCDRVLDAAEMARRSLIVAHTLRSEPFVTRLVAQIKEAVFGRLHLAVFRWYTDELRRLEAPGHWKGTLAESGGGVLSDGGPHVADLANLFLGRALRVQARGRTCVATREGLGEDTAVLVIEHASGAISTAALSFTAGAAFRRAEFACGVELELFGTEAAVACGFRIRDGSRTRYFREYRRGEQDRIEEGEGGGDGFAWIDRKTIECLRSGAPPPVTPLEARNAVAVVEAAYKSLASGAVEDVDWRE